MGGSGSAKKTGNVRVVTINKNREARLGTYYRLSLYEFKGDPPKAFFVQDLSEGFWDFKAGIYRGKQKAKELNVLFLDNISMGDSIQKVYAHVLS